MRRARRAIVVVAVVLAAGVPAWRPVGAAATATPWTITRAHRGPRRPPAGAVLEEDVAIDVRYGDTPQLALLLAEEGDRTPADVFWGQEARRHRVPADRDLLAPFSREVLDLVDPGFEDPEGL